MVIVLKSIARGIGKTVINSIGIAIGAAAVLIINALSNYGIDSAQKMLNRMGIDGYVVTSNNILYNDILTLSDCPAVESISPIVSSVSNDTEEKLTFLGCQSTLKEMYSLTMSDGRFIADTDVDTVAPVCIISSHFAINKFGTVNCTGQQLNVTINSISQLLDIKGVYQSDSIINSTGIPTEEPIYVPYTLLNAINADCINSLIITTCDGVSQQNSTNQIKMYCNLTFGESNYKLDNVAENREKIDSLMNIIKGVLEVIVGVSLLVSVISLMVIMIINVRSRAGEIGLKKALGATDMSILLEISVEGVLTTVMGVLQGGLYYFVIKLLCKPVGINLNTDISLFINLMMIAIIGAAIISLIPGYIAAKIDPAKALKND